MTDLVDLVLALSRRGATPAATATPRVLWLAAIGFCAAVCAVGAVACSLSALWLYSADRIGTIGATLVVAAVLALGCLGFVVLAGRQRPTRTVPQSREVIPAIMIAETLGLIRRHRGAVLIAAVIAGMALARTEK